MMCARVPKSVHHSTSEEEDCPTLRERVARGSSHSDLFSVSASVPSSLRAAALLCYETYEAPARRSCVDPSANRVSKLQLRQRNIVSVNLQVLDLLKDDPDKAEYLDLEKGLSEARREPNTGAAHAFH